MLNLRNKNKESVVKKRAYFDGMYNRHSGVGTKKDISISNKIEENNNNYQTYEALYDNLRLAKRVVDIVPQEATREWINITNLEQKQKQRLIDELKRLNIKDKIYQQARYSKLYGAGALFIVDGTSLEKLELPLGQPKTIKNLILFNPSELQASSEKILDINSPSFGLPMYYSIVSGDGKQNLQSHKIHHSRLIIMQGDDISKTAFENNNYFSYGILGSLQKIIQDWTSSHNQIPNIISKYNKYILKMNGMAAMLIENVDENGDCKEGQKIIQDKADQLDNDVNTMGIGIIDGEDSMEIVNPNLAGFNETLARLDKQLIVESEIPHTILMGESPKASNGTGNSTTLDWYNKISIFQENKIRPSLKYILDIITNYLNISEWDFEFNPLWQPTEKEIAETRKIISESDKTYIETGVLSSDEVRQSRFGGETYNPDTTIEGELDDLAESEETTAEQGEE